MGFDKPVEAKRYYSGKAITLCIAAVILFFIPIIVSDIDAEGRIFSFLIAGILFLTAIYNFVRYKKAPSESKVYEIISTAPAKMKIKHFKLALGLCYFIWPIFTAITAWELKELETGKISYMDLWSPFAFIYIHAGYWPTILSVLFIGAMGVVLFKWQIEKLSQKTKE
ncbi:MAG: hypothetical protein PHV60_09580 [bacterium]|nr:hypothetical protein [bacterium]